MLQCVAERRRGLIFLTEQKVVSSPAGSMKARIPRMLLTVCAEGQALDMLMCPAVTGTPGGLPILVPVGDMVLG